MDDVIKKQIGYWIMAIWAAFGFALFDLIIDLPVLWIIFIVSSYYATDVLIFFMVRYYFGVEEESKPPIPEPPIVIDDSGSKII